MQDKKALVRAYAFLKPPLFHGSEYQPKQRSAYLLITQEAMAKTLLCQSVKKAPGPNMHNFRALRLIYVWMLIILRLCCNKLYDYSISHNYGGMQKEF